MIDFILDVWDWIIERFQDAHEILCSIPTVGDLFDQYPLLAYAMFSAIIGICAWFWFFDGANKLLMIYRG